MSDVKHFDVDGVLDDVVRLFWRQGWSATGIQNVVAVTGVSRSSLYATFGGKNSLYVAALRGYIEKYSAPAFARLASGASGVLGGLPAVEEFFAALIRQRCAGPHAGWGCLITNAHAGPECSDPQVRELLDEHHLQVREAMCGALAIAAERGQLTWPVDLDAVAGVLVVLAYGVNLRSRAGADAETLHSAVATVLHPLRATHPPEEG
ncbi:MAG: TetR/AcrR family transcriptional regulator [Actinomadura sp.]